MQAKGVIRQQVTWAQSRHFFYWRLRRRLAEFDVARNMRETDSTIQTRNDAIEIMKGWFFESGGTEEVWRDDKKAMIWLQENTATLRSRLLSLKETVLARDLGNRFSDMIQTAADDSSSGGLDSLISRAMAQLSEEDRKALKAAIAKTA